MSDDEALVMWDDKTQDVVPINNLTIVDRAFMHGDIVSRVSDPLGPTGTVIQVELECDLESVISSSTKKNHHETSFEYSRVNTRDMQLMHNYRFKHYAVYDNKWLCRVDRTLFDLLILFKDGSKCILRKVDAEHALNEDEYFCDQDPFYPSQTLHFKSNYRRSLLKKADWLVGQYDREVHVKAVVLNVKASDAILEYVTSSNPGSVEDQEMPQGAIDFQKLRVFSHYFRTNWAVSDRGYYAPNVNKETIQSFFNAKDIVDRDMTPFTVLVKRTYTRFDVHWQDGTVERNLNAIDFIPRHHLGDTDFNPEDIVTKRDADTDEEKNNMIGVVKRVNSREGVCAVQWLDQSKNNQLLEFEELSIYDIKDSSKYSFTLGDIVILKKEEQEKMGHDFWAGEIIDIRDAQLTVSWINQQTETIFAVRMDQVLSASNMVDELEDALNQLDTEDDENSSSLIHLSLQEGNGGDGDDDTDDTEEDSDVDEDDDDDERHVQQIRIDDAMEDVDIDEDGGGDDDDEGWITVSDGEDEDEELDNNFGQVEEMPEYPEEDEEEEARNRKIGFKNSLDIVNYIGDENLASKCMSMDSVSERRKVLEPQQSKLGPIDPKLNLHQFQIIFDPSDHEFAEEEEQPLDAEYMDILHAEWNALLKNIPPDTFVLVYHSKSDIMRAIIIGPEKTPYYGCPLVFDIWMPSSYPDEPPHVHCVSYDENLHPYLHKDGNVSLPLLEDSLHEDLNNDDEDDDAQWHPDKSNTCQVLRVLQIVLQSSEPYYLEDGYEDQRDSLEGNHNSARFNENVVLLCLNHLLKSLTQPLKGTEELLFEHMKRNWPTMRANLALYLVKDSGNSDRKASEEELDTFGLKTSQVSKGFKLRLHKILQKLDERVNQFTQQK